MARSHQRVPVPQATSLAATHWREDGAQVAPSSGQWRQPSGQTGRARGPRRTETSGLPWTIILAPEVFCLGKKKEGQEGGESWLVTPNYWRVLDWWSSSVVSSAAAPPEMIPLGWIFLHFVIRRWPAKRNRPCSPQVHHHGLAQCFIRQ